MVATSTRVNAKAVRSGVSATSSITASSRMTVLTVASPGATRMTALVGPWIAISTEPSAVQPAMSASFAPGGTAACTASGAIARMAPVVASTRQMPQLDPSPMATSERPSGDQTAASPTTPWPGWGNPAASRRAAPDRTSVTHSASDPDGSGRKDARLRPSGDQLGRMPSATTGNAVPSAAATTISDGTWSGGAEGPDAGRCVAFRLKAIDRPSGDQARSQVSLASPPIRTTSDPSTGMTRRVVSSSPFAQARSRVPSGDHSTWRASSRAPRSGDWARSALAGSRSRSACVRPSLVAVVRRKRSRAAGTGTGAAEGPFDPDAAGPVALAEADAVPSGTGVPGPEAHAATRISERTTSDPRRCIPL